MSRQEYSFHSRKKRDLNPALTSSYSTPSSDSSSMNDSQPRISPTETRQIVLRAFDHFLSLKLENPRIKYLSETQDTLSKEIVDTVGILQGSAGHKEQTSQLTAKIEHLTQLHNQLKEEYTETMKTELQIIYDNWPDLFDKFLEGIDREALDHALMVFEEQMKGKYDMDTAISHGIDWMRKKYSLPEDFFDKSGIDAFKKNLYQGQK
jgi:hypothetical protein